jgi:Zn-dependent protease
MSKVFIFINLFLCFFNLIPLHPLDGGKVIARFIPYRANRWLEENQFTMQMLLIVGFITGGFWFIAGPVYFIGERLIGSAVLISQMIV